MTDRTKPPLHGLDRARARRIRKAVLRAEAVRDPRDAGYAVAQARQIVEWATRHGVKPWLLLVHVVVEILVIVLTRDLALAVIFAIPPPLFLIGLPLQRRMLARVQHSLELNEQLATAFAIEIPELPVTSTTVPPIRSRPGVIAIALTIGVVVAFITLQIVTRDEGQRPVLGGPPSSWARNAKAACSDMAARRRKWNARYPSPSGPSRDVPLEQLAAAARAGVEIEQDAATTIRASDPPPPGPAGRAIDAFERKIQYEWDAIRAAEAGDRAGFVSAIAQSIRRAVDARLAFNAAGAPRCASLM